MKFARLPAFISPKAHAGIRRSEPSPRAAPSHPAPVATAMWCGNWRALRRGICCRKISAVSGLALIALSHPSFAGRHCACLAKGISDILPFPVPGDVHSLAIAPAVAGGKSGHHRAGFPLKRGALRLTRSDGKCHRKSNRPSRAQARTARVQRRGKSPPRRQ